MLRSWARVARSLSTETWMLALGLAVGLMLVPASEALAMDHNECDCDGSTYHCSLAYQRWCWPIGGNPPDGGCTFFTSCP